MDSIRFEKLMNGEQYMSADLLGEIEQLRHFDEQYNATVCVLCSDKRLKSKMDKLFPIYADIDLKICGTYDDNIDEAIVAARYSDAIIVNTQALKLAPIGLYEVIKTISNLGKACYFILSGWESLPKDTELAKNKLHQVDEEFSFARIIASANALSKQLDGFRPAEDIFEEYIQSISTSFQQLHREQTEALFSEVMRSAREFRETLRNDVAAEVSFVHKLQEIILQKEQKYVVTFSHASVRVTEIVETVERSVSYISGKDVIAKIKSDYDNPTEEFADNPDNLEKKAKELASDMITAELRKLRDKSSALLDSQNTSKITECVDDIRSVAERLNSLHYASECAQNEISDLFTCVNSTDKFSSTGASYSEDITAAIDRIIDILPKRIDTYSSVKNSFITDVVEFGMDRIRKEVEDDTNDTEKKPFMSESVTDNKKKRRHKVENDFPVVYIEQDNQKYTELIKDIKDKLTDGTDQFVTKSKWESFVRWVNEMTESSVKMLSSMLYEQAGNINNEIKLRNDEIVRAYFSNIDTKLEAIVQCLKQFSLSFEE